MINSRAKGCVGEREWRDVLHEWGYNARRGQQFSGSNGDADVVCEDLPFHFEVKRVQNLNIEKAMQQAKNDAKNKIPLVAHRRNGEQWKVTLYAEDFFGFLEEYSEFGK